MHRSQIREQVWLDDRSSASFSPTSRDEKAGSTSPKCFRQEKIHNKAKKSKHLHNYLQFLQDLQNNRYSGSSGHRASELFQLPFPWHVLSRYSVHEECSGQDFATKQDENRQTVHY